MARISTYAIDGIPTIHDKVIGTNVDDADVTMNYTIGDIIALVPGGSASVQSLNTLTGDLNLVGAGGISISASGTDITITGSGSGIQSIDGATGPDIDLVGKGGITITAVGNLINIDGSGISGGSPGAPNLGVQYNDGGNFAAGDFFTVDLKGYANPAVNIGKNQELKGQLNIFSGTGEGSFFGETRYYDAIGSGQYASWASPGQISKQSYAVALPENEPATGQVLVIDKVATSTTPYTSLWSTVGGSSADEKFKYDAADTQAGYWSEKVTIGSGLSGSVNTDVNGVKTLTISAVSYNMVNSIKVGSDTESGTFEFTGSGVTMDNSSNPTVINFDSGSSGITGVIGPNASVVGDITFNGALVSQTGNTFSFDLPKSGLVTSVTATNPIKSSGGTTPDISMSAASATGDGYLSSGDFATFNSKQDALVSGTNIKTVNGNSLLGSGNLAITATATPGGSASNVQFHNSSGLLDGDIQFTYNLDSVNKIATVKIGDEVSPSETYGVLRLDGNNGSQGGKVEFRTGSSKAVTPKTITLQAPTSGVDQVISLPETLPTAGTQVLGLKAISGTDISTQWVDQSASSLPYTSYEVLFSTAGGVVNAKQLNNTTALTFGWTDNRNGTLTVKASGTLPDTDEVFVLLNGFGGSKGGIVQCYFGGFDRVQKEIQIDIYDEVLQNQAIDIIQGNFELRIY
jgi:hypothetical protein